MFEQGQHGWRGDDSTPVSYLTVRCALSFICPRTKLLIRLHLTYPGGRRVNIPKMKIGHGERSRKKIDERERVRARVRLHGDVSMGDCDADLCQTSEKQEYAIDEQRLGLSDKLVGRLMGCHRTWI